MGSSRGLTSGGRTKRWASSRPLPARESPVSWCGYVCLVRSSAGAIFPADSSAEEMHLREQVFQQHDRYLKALLVGDLDGVLGTIHDRAASAVRDYVEDTGTLTALVGLKAHADYFGAFFDKFEVVSAEPLCRVTEEWYAFAEVRVTAEVKSGSAAGQSVAFHTAEFHVPANDGRFIARIGHGTDLA